MSVGMLRGGVGEGGGGIFGVGVGAGVAVGVGVGSGTTIVLASVGLFVLREMSSPHEDRAIAANIIHDLLSTFMRPFPS